MSKQQRCLVTGGSGFIGSHLAQELLRRGYVVVVYDNLLTGDKNNLKEIIDHPTFTSIEKDITVTDFADQKFDYIFHLASPASVIDYQKYPEETALVNSFGTYKLLQLAEKCQAKILFASTSEVYGDPKEHPQKETYWGNVNPNGVRSCYDEAKRYGEMMMMLFHRKYAIDEKIIRIFNTYGPRMRPTDGRVISNFITQALQNDPITVYGDGLQTRSFCFVADLVLGICEVMFSEKSSGQVFNLGNPEEYAILALARKIIELTDSKSELVFKDLPQDDPKERQPDIEKVTTMLGWKPTVSLHDGLVKTIAYYRHILAT
jgi:nucleoside-diphosphate-sugar epimerase